MKSSEEPVWNRPGYHHICLKVKDLHETYQIMIPDGVKFYFEPKVMVDRKELAHRVFFKDPDGNMIELQD